LVIDFFLNSNYPSLPQSDLLGASARELAAKQRTIEELRGEMERMEGQILAQRGQLQGVRGELEEGQREERHFDGENERLARLVEMRRGRGKGGELASGTFRPSVSSNSIRSATPKGLLAILIVKSTGRMDHSYLLSICCYLILPGVP